MPHSLSLPTFPTSLSSMSRDSKHRLTPSSNGDFELRHWRSFKSRKRPTPITIPNGNNTSHGFYEISPAWNGHEDGGYISLRDILTSPEYAELSSPVRGGSCPEINISNPLVKHAAYAYLQPNPSARGTAMRRHLGVKQVLLEIFSPCLEFLGAIFNFGR